LPQGDSRSPNFVDVAGAVVVSLDEPLPLAFDVSSSLRLDPHADATSASTSATATSQDERFKTSPPRR
jgi:hypothetical protein